MTHYWSSVQYLPFGKETAVYVSLFILADVKECRGELKYTFQYVSKAFP